MSFDKITKHSRFFSKYANIRRHYFCPWLTSVFHSQHRSGPCQTSGAQDLSLQFMIAPVTLQLPEVRPVFVHRHARNFQVPCEFLKRAARIPQLKWFYCVFLKISILFTQRSQKLIYPTLLGTLFPDVPDIK